MSLARKLILHSPLSDETLLKGFVEQCLLDQVSLLAIFGPGADRLEDEIAQLVVGDGSDPERFLCTTSHPDENLDEVFNMMNHWKIEQGGTIEQVYL
ncbi:hypothetical protein ACLBWS_14475 [Brucellaceae bacterium D45D]